MDVEFFSPRNILSPTSVVFLTNHDTWLTARGQRSFFTFVFFLATVSNAADTM